jgi:hypothetical protein
LCFNAFNQLGFVVAPSISPPSTQQPQPLYVFALQPAGGKLFEADAFQGEAYKLLSRVGNSLRRAAHAVLCSAWAVLGWEHSVYSRLKLLHVSAELEDGSKGYMCDGTICITVCLTTTCLNMPASREGLAEVYEGSEEHSYSDSGSNDDSHSDSDG